MAKSVRDGRSKTGARAGRSWTSWSAVDVRLQRRVDGEVERRRYPEVATQANDRAAKRLEFETAAVKEIRQHRTLHRGRYSIHERHVTIDAVGRDRDAAGSADRRGLLEHPTEQIASLRTGADRPGGQPRHRHHTAAAHLKHELLPDRHPNVGRYLGPEAGPLQHRLDAFDSWAGATVELAKGECARGRDVEDCARGLDPPVEQRGAANRGARADDPTDLLGGVDPILDRQDHRFW